MHRHSNSVADSFVSEKRILFTRPALKNFNRLKSTHLRNRINARIQKLALNPYPRNCKKLKSIRSRNLWEIAQGSYRVWYEPRCAVDEIEIVWIGHHQDDFRKPNFIQQMTA